MYKNEFDNLLKQNKKFDAYMFYGQSTFLIDYYSNLVAQSIAHESDIQRIYFDEYDFKFIKEQLLQSSLFSSTNLIIIKTEKKIQKKELTELINACNINPDSTLIFSCLGDIEFKTMSSSFSAKTNSVSVRMFAPYINEALKLLEKEARAIGLDYEMSALNHLYFMHRHDLSLCINDLKKLVILDKKINTNLINSHCFGIGNVSFEDFLNDLILGNDISEELQLLLEEGMNEIYLLNQITSFVQQLFMISAYTRAFGTPNAKEILGYVPPKNIWEKKSKLAISIKPEVFQEMFEFLLDLELKLKSTKINKENLFLQASLRKFTVMFR
ncbi:DNA polymerase III subunit delta [Malaciobacter marinus]|uniref:DNA polymerase III subunit delta n=1 Tax=Malaciobacter marinus TaxID=505249 RepID=A0A347TNL1_9BACT|nr:MULTISPECIES: DNA polymerase III subunit delta [Malaciobacter]AXX88189.1 DNA polymerase III, delta subunit [Malaciobacter marinus]PHO13894.1 DNA polymerase III subunit delta [Malaciobacter marinus]PHO15083.1 DNA polymerase III subunit delta [Malaciobacter marinus]RYA24397.1 DNA polymerase III subunit delta [Malaciobacter halophilus]